MLLNQNKTPNLIKRRSLKDPKERERILMQYGGVFKNAIPEYAKLIKRIRPVKNYSE
jgi:hypothetical protein